MLSRPGVHLHCDVNYDPFVYLHENNIVYGSFLSCLIHRIPDSILFKCDSGFTIAMREYRRTIESLWSTVRGMSHPLPQHAELCFMLHGSRSPHDRFHREEPKICGVEKRDGLLVRQRRCRLQPLSLCVLSSFAIPLQGAASDHHHHIGGVAIK